jgi:hypothetical protein
VSSGWHRRPCAARWVILFPQGDPPHSTSGTTTKELADHNLHSQDDRHPSHRVRPDLGELTVTNTSQQLVDARSALSTSSLPFFLATKRREGSYGQRNIELSGSLEVEVPSVSSAN